MRWSLFAVLACGLQLTATAPKEDPAKKELEKLQGIWVLEGDGLKDRFKGRTTLAVTGEKWALNGEGSHWGPSDEFDREHGAGSFKLDPGKKPKAFDVTVVPDKDEPPPLFDFKLPDPVGIYEVEGDLLKLCLGFQRPTKFEMTKPGADLATARIFTTWKRETRVLGAAKERVALNVKGVQGLRFVGGNNTLAAFIETPNEGGRPIVKVWDLAARKEVTSLKVENVAFVEHTITADGKTLLAVDWEKKGNSVVRMLDTRTGEVRAALKVQNTDLLSATLTPDGKYVVAGGRGEPKRVDDRMGLLKVWEVKSGKELFNWARGNKYQQVAGVAITSDGKCVVWGTSRGLGSRHGHLGLLHLDGDKTRDFELKVPDRSFYDTDVQSLKVSADGKTLAAAFRLEDPRGRTGGGVAVLWDLPSGGQRPLSLKSRVPLRVIALSPDGKTLATVPAGTDALVTLWDVEKTRERVVLRHAAAVRALEFSPDGKSLAVADGSEVKVWTLPE